jgi:uncharacterized protein
MDGSTLTLSVMPGAFAICQLRSSAEIPDWALAGPIFSITRTHDELSIVCPQVSVPDGTKCDKDWRCLKVEGPYDFCAIGIIALLAEPLALAGISIFVMSTFDTDYLMVKEESLAKAIRVLSESGHRVSP